MMKSPTQRQLRRAAERKMRKQMRKERRMGTGAALTVAGLGLALAANADAATYTVLNTGDAGADTLRQAILDANANPGADVINFAASATGTINLISGQLSITDEVDIQGPGSDQLTVDGQDNSRVFYLYSGSGVDVTISGLTVSNGYSSGYGGGIVVWGDHLILDDVVVSDNRADSGGGGIYVWEGELTIQNCEVTGNTSYGEGGGLYISYGGPALIENSRFTYNYTSGDGGGILVYSMDDTLTILNSEISGNISDDNGGGLYIDTDADVRIENCTINNNFAYYTGGGLAVYYISGSLDIRDSEISGNFTGYDGGGLYIGESGGPITVERTRITNNTAYDDGGGVFMYWLGHETTFYKCTISGNTAYDGGGVFLYDTDSTIEKKFVGYGYADQSLLIQNCTISGNRADNYGGGVFLYSPDALVKIENTTISGNTADYDAALSLYGGYAELNFCTVAGNTADRFDGAVWVNDGYYVGLTIKNSIVAGNTSFYGGNDDLSGIGQINAEYSLLGGVSPYLNDIAGNLVGVDPQLGPLQDNGGLTETMMPAETSPVIDAADPLFVGPPDSDQRGPGYDRIENDRADMGAVEVAGLKPEFAWNDFDGDGKSDLPIFYPLTGGWFVKSPEGSSVVPGWQWGYKGVKPVAGDFNGDGTADLSVFDLKSGKWYINAVLSPNKGAVPMGILANGWQWGFMGAQPIAGDYDGDGISDPGVYNPFDGRWYIRSLAGEVLHFGTQWGYKGAQPIPGDYDGNGVMDLTVYDPQTGMWYMKFNFPATPASKRPALEALAQRWGFPGSIAVPGDYNGDGMADLAVYSRFDGRWYILSLGGAPLDRNGGFPSLQVLAFMRQWGYAGAVPVPGDFNGDGKSDLAVYDPGTGKWFVQSLDGTVLLFGQNWGGFKGAELILP